MCQRRNNILTVQKIIQSVELTPVERQVAVRLCANYCDLDIISELGLRSDRQLKQLKLSLHKKLMDAGVKF